MIKLAIVGSRSFNDYEKFSKLAYQEIRSEGILNYILISGGAFGVDKMAEKLSRTLTTTHPVILLPDYERYNKIAPLMRNREIARQCDIMIAFWNGLSGGTANAIAWATFYGRRTIVIEI